MYLYPVVLKHSCPPINRGTNAPSLAVAQFRAIVPLAKGDESRFIGTEGVR